MAEVFVVARDERSALEYAALNELKLSRDQRKDVERRVFPDEVIGRAGLEIMRLEEFNRDGDSDSWDLWRVGASVQRLDY
jgi:hypothetical protein